MVALIASPSQSLRGRLTVPGDKSISHRALLLAGLAVGESEIHGLLEGEDVLRTAAAMSVLGAEVERGEGGVWHVWGRGIGGLVQPASILDMGNSGTGARLLIGLLASHPLTSVVTGDASLTARPMARVTGPLERMGATIITRPGGRLPATVVGSARPMPIHYVSPVASAQVKSAVLLAGLAAPGRTTVVETQATRDHTEILLRHFGATVDVAVGDEAAGRRISVTGQPELAGRRVDVAGDPSSAAFAVVAGLLLPGSEITLPRVGINPHRNGLFRTLVEMGADLAIERRRVESGEAVADLTVRHSDLEGIEVPAERAPSMIDEYPILAVAAAAARGTTRLMGLGELRVKESDRLSAIAQGLAACGVTVTEGPDSLTVEGAGGRPRGGNKQPIKTRLDHRIAMSFLILGLASERPVAIDDGGPMDTSFPGFTEAMRGLGAKIAAPGRGKDLLRN